MFSFLKKRIYPIGVYPDGDAVKMVQLGYDGKRTCIIAGSSEAVPANITPGSSDWQRWTVEAVKKIRADHDFKGRQVIAALPANEVFIAQLKLQKVSDAQMNDAIVSTIRQKLPFDPSKAMIKYVTAEGILSEKNMRDVVVMATDRTKVERHLAIYENAGLQIKSLSVWPLALARCYRKFFGRRDSDINSVVMLLDITAESTEVVITRCENLLFCRVVDMGIKELDNERGIEQLATEIGACRRHYESMFSGAAQIDRVIFMSGSAVETAICQQIAEQLELPAHIGDCLQAVDVKTKQGPELDRRGCRDNWAVAFGLSLS